MNLLALLALTALSTALALAAGRRRLRGLGEALYADEHMLAFAEHFAEAARGALTEGLGRMRSPAGVNVFYAQEEAAGRVRHSYSVSLTGARGRAAGLARPFALLPLAWLGLDAADVDVRRGPAGVYTVSFALDADGHKQFAGRSFAPPSSDELPALREKMGRLAERFAPPQAS